MTPAEEEIIGRLLQASPVCRCGGDPRPVRMTCPDYRRCTANADAADLIEAQAARIAKMREDESELLLIAYLNGAAQAAEENRRLRTALADAIRRPMGVIPDSAVGLVSDRDLMEAEARRSSAEKEGTR